MLGAANGISEAGLLVIVGLGLILCLVVFIIAIVFLANRLTPDESRMNLIEADLDRIKKTMRRNGMQLSERDIPSPPLHINKGSA